MGGQGTDHGPASKLPVSVLLLNRAGRFGQEELFRQLSAHGFSEIICIESGAVAADLEQQCRHFPLLRFLLFATGLDTGSAINIGIKEARSPHVLVLWNDMSLLPYVESNLRKLLSNGALCTVPLIRSPRGEVVPSLSMPAEHNNSLKILQVLPSRENIATLFPFAYVGFYDREQFLSSLGYDTAIRNPFWQKIDFGYRAYLWGYRMLCQTDLRIQSSLEIEPEDSTPDGSYARFYLRNVLPRFLGDQAVLPRSRFLTYSAVARRGLFRDLKDFSESADWVKTNAWRFKRDARHVAELWDTGEDH